MTSKRQDGPIVLTLTFHGTDPMTIEFPDWASARALFEDIIYEHGEFVLIQTAVPNFPVLINRNHLIYALEQVLAENMNNLHQGNK